MYESWILADSRESPLVDKSIPMLYGIDLLRGPAILPSEAGYNPAEIDGESTGKRRDGIVRNANEMRM